jgi:CRP/FNR family transcriptional regulator, cyclic AMP receptor protein
MTKILLFQNSEDYEGFKAGETIYEEGEYGDFMYVIIDGEVEVWHDGAQIDTLSAGDIVGELALIDHKPRSTTVRAKTDAKMVSISQKRFLFLVEQTPFFALHVMQTLAERLRKNTGRI